MSNYINKVTLKESKFGIKFSGKTEEVIAQLKAITNEKGYFNLEIQKRKEAGKYGDTHYLKVDDWKPSEKLPTFAERKDKPVDLPF
jgi:hypothetical protein